MSDQRTQDLAAPKPCAECQKDYWKHAGGSRHREERRSLDRLRHLNFMPIGFRRACILGRVRVDLSQRPGSLQGDAQHPGMVDDSLSREPPGTIPLNGTPCGVHRTFLMPDGSEKASVDKPKMMLGPAGVIRLAEAIGEGLGLAEGIESALSVLQAIGWRSVWAAGTRGGIQRFPVIPGHCLTVFADSDTPGMKAARACTARWTAPGLETWIHVPPVGQDWNDAARRLAA